jgi:hypothetical protein
MTSQTLITPQVVESILAQKPRLDQGLAERELAMQ